MASSIPCKYFLRNECRFGDNCRFYHPRGNSGGFGNRNLGPSHFNNPSHQQDVINLSAKSQQNMDTMAEMVKKDMIEWDLGKIWPFSSYGPAGNKPSLPGFEDISPEELRYQYLQNNRVPPDLSQQMRNIQLARANYQQPTPAIRNVLERVIVKGERISESSSSGGWGGSSNTAAPSTQGIFGGSGVFGGSGSGFQSTNSSGFGSNNSTFSFASRLTSQPNVDGMESAEANPASSIFSQPQQSTGLFSTQPTSQSQGFGTFSSFGQPFGASQPQQQQQQVQAFSQPQQSLFQTQQAPAFGQVQQQSSNIFQATNQQSTSGSFQSPQLQSLLQSPQPLNNFQTISNQSPQPPAVNPTSNSPFSFSLGASSTVPVVSSSPSIFGGPQQQPATNTPTSSIFGTPPIQNVGNPLAPASSSPSIFGGTFSTQPSAVPPTSSIFGPPPSQTTSILGNPPSSSIFSAPGSAPLESNSYSYSEESELTPEELEAFKADYFTLESVPIRPPPKSLCGM